MLCAIERKERMYYPLKVLEEQNKMFQKSKKEMELILSKFNNSPIKRMETAEAIRYGSAFSIATLFYDYESEADYDKKMRRLDKTVYEAQKLNNLFTNFDYISFINSNEMDSFIVDMLALQDSFGVIRDKEDANEFGSKISKLCEVHGFDDKRTYLASIITSILMRNDLLKSYNLADIRDYCSLYATIYKFMEDKQVFKIDNTFSEHMRKTDDKGFSVTIDEARHLPCKTFWLDVSEDESFYPVKGILVNVGDEKIMTCQFIHNEETGHEEYFTHYYQIGMEMDEQIENTILGSEGHFGYKSQDLEVNIKAEVFKEVLKEYGVEKEFTREKAQECLNEIINKYGNEKMDEVYDKVIQKMKEHESDIMEKSSIESTNSRFLNTKFALFIVKYMTVKEPDIIFSKPNREKVESPISLDQKIKPSSFAKNEMGVVFGNAFRKYEKKVADYILSLDSTDSSNDLSFETHRENRPHYVSAHYQHYHTKNGLILNWKEPYWTGIDKEDKDKFITIHKMSKEI